MESLNQVVEFESGSLFLFEKNSRKLKEVASKGESIDFIRTIHFPRGTGLSAWVAQKGKVIYLPDIHRGSRHGLNPVRSYLSMPLVINNKIIGVLNLGHVVPNAFGAKEIKQIESLSKEVTRKLYNLIYLNLNSYGEKNSSY
jgi:GAF domain-containing protein